MSKISEGTIQLCPLCDGRMNAECHSVPEPDAVLLTGADALRWRRFRESIAAWNAALWPDDAAAETEQHEEEKA